MKTESKKNTALDAAKAKWLEAKETEGAVAAQLRSAQARLAEGRSRRGARAARNQPTARPAE